MRARMIVAAAFLTLALTGFLEGTPHPLPRAVPAASVRLNDPAPRLPRVLRFRVIAAADTPYDEAVKIAVRNLVLQELEPVLLHVHSVSAAREPVASQIPRLRILVQRLLRHDEAPYRARLSLGVTTFPTKAYGLWVLPAGRYPALVIRLGAAQGHNWWCVLFPSLCFIDTNSGLAVPITGLPAMSRRPQSPVRVEWWIPFRQWLQGL